MQNFWHLHDFPTFYPNVYLELIHDLIEQRNKIVQRTGLVVWEQMTHSDRHVGEDLVFEADHHSMQILSNTWKIEHAESGAKSIPKGVPNVISSKDRKQLPT